MRAFPTLLLVCLFPLVPAIPHGAIAETCVSTDLGGVCVTADPLCPSAWCEPPFEDFSAGGEHCLMRTPTDTGEDACSHLRAGTYAKPTAREYDGALCVETSRPGSAGCVEVTYNGNLGRPPSRLLCVLP